VRGCSPGAYPDTHGDSHGWAPEAPVGRLIFTANALPAVRLMNFARTDGLIVMRIAADSTVVRKLDGVIVTFEADEVDARTRSGWLVMLTGPVKLITDPAGAGTGRCRWSPRKVLVAPADA
jgi:uncharacterized protein